MLYKNLAILDSKKAIKSIILAYKDNEITILSKGQNTRSMDKFH